MTLKHLLAAAAAIALSACVTIVDNGDSGDPIELAMPQPKQVASLPPETSVAVEWEPVENAASYLCKLSNGYVESVFPKIQDTDELKMEKIKFFNLEPDTKYTFEVQAIAFTGNKYKDSKIVAIEVVTSPEEESGSSGTPGDEQQTPGDSESDEWKLVWSDEFNGTELDSSVWNIEVDGNGGGNFELQYYTARPENVTVKDGCLVLTARKEEYSGKTATSGRVNTRNNKAFKYGRFDASIKLPKTANGLWPAYWTMGNDFDAVEWPACGEIDILEMGHSNGFASGMQERFLNGAAHWGPAWDKKGDYAKEYTCPYSLQDGEFHLFTLIWNETSLKTYIDLDTYPDATPYFEMNITDKDGELAPGNYFHKENFIIFNLAVGGQFPGIYDINQVTALANGPAEMLIDYVRVYTKKQ